MSAREVYAFDKPVTDRDQAAAICAAVIDVLRERIGSAQFDVYSDHEDAMPARVREAEERLDAAARKRPHTPPDPRMGLVVSSEQPEWADFETYASWSIDVDLRDIDGEWLADFHDSGYSIVATLSELEAQDLRERVGTIAELTLLSEIHRRRASERRDRRRQRLRRLLRLH